MTSTALLTGQVFPYVTHPHFEIGAGYVDGMGGIMNCAFAPLVKAKERSDWEEYATRNQGWLEESARLRIVHPEHADALHGTIQDHEHDSRRLEEDLVEIPPIRKRIWKWEDGKKVIEEEDSDTEIFAPLWQISAPEASTVNVNLFYDERVNDLYAAMIATNQTVMSSNTKIYDLFDFAFDDSVKERKENPHGFIMDPVYSAFEENPTIVGFLMALSPFDTLLGRLLPEDAEGMIAVITDTCGKEMTYELNGKMATFLGYDDLHDPDFDEYEFSKVMEMYETIAEDLCVNTVRRSKRVW
jgi:hypothetical protein